MFSLLTQRLMGDPDLPSFAIAIGLNYLTTTTPRLYRTGFSSALVL